nr:methyl-accepting chemotaxis protein [uncultured Ralstonia sp.]
MKLAIKLPLAFAAALLLMFAGAIYGIASLSHSIVEYNTTVQARVADERAVTKMLVTFKTQVQEWKDTLLRGEDPVKLDKYWGAFVKGEQAVTDQAKALQASLPPGKSRDLIAQFATAHVAMGVGYRKGHDMFVAASFDPTVGDKVVAGVDREPARLLDEAAQEIAKESAAVSAKTAQTAHIALVVSVVLMLAAFGLGLAGAFLFSRSITRPLSRAVDVASAVSHGDLAKPFEARGTDEIGQLLIALKEMQTSLASVVSEVRRNVEGVASASSQIASGNLSLSSRTEAQAASLQETAANIEQITATVRLNSENAVQASTLAGHASDTASRGGKVMSDVVQTMQGISESSARVGEIIGVIDSIAFQTNILALNAAVEAARAGEQGRGFAVVAGEVRTLAQRSATAAKEIKGLIGQSTERVEAGARLVQDAGCIIDEIVASVQRVTQIVAEISSASAEQSTGIEQVNIAVGQIEEVTQQNAALVEEASAAAQAMADQADALRRAVAIFKVDMGGAAALA